MNNERTSLIEEKRHGYHGVGFETKINGKLFRCAVKLPLNATGKKWEKARCLNIYDKRNNPNL